MSGGLSTLPNIESKEVQKFYHVRIKKQGITIQQVSEWIKSSKYKKWLFSIEDVGGIGQHFHCRVPADRTKKVLLQELKEVFEVFGNGEYSIELERTDNLESYIVKGKQYWSGGYTDQELKVAEKKSYKKYSKDEFARLVQEVDNDYLVGKINMQQWGIRFINLKVSFNQSPNSSWFKAHVIMLRMKKDPMFINSWVHTQISDALGCGTLVFSNDVDVDENL